ncbi:MAG: cupin domain-containing protein [Deltaproteobacteria bacterium]|nr:cupin domain-containing protein [Deltaproteobacteria bacterium]
MENKYFIKPQEVPPYIPRNHVGTENRRLVGSQNGAEKLEVILGVLQKGPGALPHAHPGMEQVCYMLQGRAQVEVAGYKREIGPGECVFFPASEPHVFAVVSDEPVKLLVIYSPPYNESPAQAVLA